RRALEAGSRGTGGLAGGDAGKEDEDDDEEYARNDQRRLRAAATFGLHAAAIEGDGPGGGRPPGRSPHPFTVAAEDERTMNRKRNEAAHGGRPRRSMALGVGELSGRVAAEVEEAGERPGAALGDGDEALARGRAELRKPVAVLERNDLTVGDGG